jgi:hypothetical protein
MHGQIRPGELGHHLPASAARHQAADPGVGGGVQANERDGLDPPSARGNRGKDGHSFRTHREAVGRILDVAASIDDARSAHGSSDAKTGVGHVGCLGCMTGGSDKGPIGRYQFVPRKAGATSDITGYPRS